MIGGNLLGQGGYGCVFHPAILCKKRKKKINKEKFVTKIQRKNKSSTNEFDISRKIKKIPFYKNYFVPVDHQCNINIQALNIDTEDFNRCETFKKSDNSKYVSMQLRKINGVEMIDYIKDFHKRTFFLKNITNSYGHLLIGIKNLADNGIIHFDLKFQNIMYSFDSNLPLIIDYGLSIDITKVREKLTQYFYTSGIYTPWCLEIHLLNYLLNNNPNPTKIELNELAYRFLYGDEDLPNGNKSILQQFSKQFIDNYFKLCKKQLLSYMNLTFEKKIEKILKSFKTWDNYSLSIAFLNLLKPLFKMQEGFKKSALMIFWTKLLLENIHPNPEKRNSIENTIVMFNKFFFENHDYSFDTIKKSINNNKNVISNMNKLKIDTEKMASIIQK